MYVNREKKQCIIKLFKNTVKEEFEDFNGVIHKLMKHRQHNGHKSTKGEKRSTKQTHKTKDRVTRTPIKTGQTLLSRCFYFL
jgi:regulatory protein YycI of two-component signal transduction system YycFG